MASDCVTVLRGWSLSEVLLHKALSNWRKAALAAPSTVLSFALAPVSMILPPSRTGSGDKRHSRVHEDEPHPPCTIDPGKSSHRASRASHGSYSWSMGAMYSLPPPLRKCRIKKLRQAKVPWGSKKTAHG